MTNKLFIVTLEPLEQRYTRQWYEYFKTAFSKYFDVKYIDGKYDNKGIEKGRFLDVNKTNRYKAQQIEIISNLFYNETIKDGDIFFFCDGWHYGITALKYMSQLNNIKIKIYGYLHAGTWDENDFITQVGMRDWACYNEIGWIKALDGAFVATHYHKNLILKFFDGSVKYNKIHVVGFPLDWKNELSKYNLLINSTGEGKFRNLIVFPHRLNKEKNPESFYWLKKNLNQYEYETTIDKNLTKEQYYKLLLESKVVFSDSFQETFGIGTVEAMMLGAIPVVPDRLAYRELYHRIFRYTSKEEARQKIHFMMNKYKRSKTLMTIFKKNQQKIIKQSLEAIPKMVKVMKNG